MWNAKRTQLLLALPLKKIKSYLSFSICLQICYLLKPGLPYVFYHFVSIDNKAESIQVIAWRKTGDKLLSESTVASKIVTRVLKYSLKAYVW